MYFIKAAYTYWSAHFRKKFVSGKMFQTIKRKKLVSNFQNSGTGIRMQTIYFPNFLNPYYKWTILRNSPKTICVKTHINQIIYLNIYENESLKWVCWDCCWVVNIISSPCPRMSGALILKNLKSILVGYFWHTNAFLNQKTSICSFL